MRILLIATGLLLTTSLLVGMNTVQACSTDGVPSLLVNNHLVAVNSAYTGKGAVGQWTPFVARGTYQAGRALALREDRAKVMQSLPPVYFRYPWRWELGDGSTALGMSVRHTYRHRGAYVVTVKAYLVGGSYKQWVAFDAATIHVR